MTVVLLPIFPVFAGSPPALGAREDGYGLHRGEIGGGSPPDVLDQRAPFSPQLVAERPTGVIQGTR